MMPPATHSDGAHEGQALLEDTLRCTLNINSSIWGYSWSWVLEFLNMLPTTTILDLQTYLSLQPRYNFLASLHDGVQFASDHDGEALVLSQRQFYVGASLLHDIQAYLGLLALTKLTVVLVAPLFQGNMEHLTKQEKHRQGGEGTKHWQVTE